MKMTKKYYYMDIWTGELFTLSEMLKRAEDVYDFDDYTNILELYDYFELTNIKVKEV